MFNSLARCTPLRRPSHWRARQHALPSARRAFATLCALLLFLTLAPKAEAYPSLLRHGYTNCTPCHADPSGSGVLTEYGRAIGEEVLRTRYAGERDVEGAGNGPLAGFLWGAVPLPRELMLGGDLRLLHLRQAIEGTPTLSRNILMQADLEAAVQVESFIASASIGYADEGALAASLSRASESNVVSRTHWAGVSLAEDSLFLRAGRLNVPFGIRTPEHTLWARRLTGTDINDQQQHGVAAAYVGARLRSEFMLIAGNFQIRPDDYRERGYSTYVDWAPLETLSLGASSRITHRELHPTYLRKTWRHAHGVFGRYAPWEPLLLMTEWNYALESPRYQARRRGVVGFLQADFEPTQGIHVIGTFEAQAVGVDSPPLSWGAWLSYAWFFAPHADLRVDSIYQSLGSDFGRVEAVTLLLQTHVYL